MPTPVNTYVVANWPDLASLAPGTNDLAVIRGSGIMARFNGALWMPLLDRERDEINPKAYALDTCAGTIGVGASDTITAAEKSNHPEWLGNYIPGLDTRDYVCLQEGIYHALAASTTTQGDIQWGGSVDMRVPAGQYYINRPLWVVGVSGWRLRGAGRVNTVIRQLALDRPAIWADGLAYSRIEAIGFDGNPNQAGGVVSHREAPVCDFNWFGIGGPTGGVGAVTGDFGTTRGVTSCDVPYVDVSAGGLAPGALAGQWLVVVKGSGIGNDPKRILTNTGSRIYIAGQWDVGTPDSSSEIVYGGTPGKVSFASSTQIIDLFTDMTGASGLLTVYCRFDGTSAPQQRTITGVDQSGHRLTVDSAFSTVPNPNATDGIFTGDGIERQWRYVVGGTLANVSAAANDVKIVATASLGTDNRFAGAFLEVTSGPAAGFIAAIRSHTGSTVMLSDPASDGLFLRAHPWELLGGTSTFRILSRPNSGAALQANSFSDLLVRYGAEVGIRYAGAGDASMGSETIWQNCHLEAFSYAGVFVRGANALNLQYIGGAISGCARYGIYVPRGTISVQGTSFGNGFSWQEGADIQVNFGQSTPYRVENVRSESKCIVSRGSREYSGGGDVAIDVSNCLHLPSTSSPFTIDSYAASMTAVVGRYYRASKNGGYGDGRLWRCVNISGDGVVGTEPSWSQMHAVSGAGANGGTAEFVRCDFTVYAGAFVHITNSTLAYGGVSEGLSIIGQRVTHSRPDPIIGNVIGDEGETLIWMGCRSYADVAGNSYPQAIDYHFTADGTVGGYSTSSSLINGALLLGGHQPGASGSTDQDVGFQHGGVDPALNYPVLALPTTYAAHPTIFGRLAPVGTDLPGDNAYLAAGAGTGAGEGGEMHLMVAPPGASGTSINPLSDALVLDTKRRMTHFGGRVVAVDARTLALGTITPDAAAGELCRISASGNVTVAAPLNPRDGARLTLEISNASGGAISVALSAAFLGAFPAPAVGKRRSQLYTFDGTASVWAPTGAQSSDV